MRVWDVATTKLAAEITEGRRLKTTGFSPDGKRVVTTTYGTAKLCGMRALASRLAWR